MVKCQCSSLSENLFYTVTRIQASDAFYKNEVSVDDLKNSFLIHETFSLKVWSR